METETERRIAVISKHELTVAHPVVIDFAQRLGWKPGTLIERIGKYLSGGMEQQLYLVVVRDWDLGIKPDTFAKALKLFEQVTCLDKPDELLLYWDYACSAYSACQEAEMHVGWKTVLQLVLSYGANAEELVELIASETFRIREELGWPRKEVLAARLYLKEISMHPGINILTADDVIDLLREYPPRDREGQQLIREEKDDDF